MIKEKSTVCAFIPHLWTISESLLLLYINVANFAISFYRTIVKILNMCLHEDILTVIPIVSECVCVCVMIVGNTSQHNLSVMSLVLVTKNANSYEIHGIYGNVAVC